MEIKLEISEESEFTSFAWWIIIDPRQNFLTDADGAHAVADMITGPYFSRQDAQNYLSNHRFNFSSNAVVYCVSGCYSDEYCDAIRKAKKKARRRAGVHSE